MDFTFKNSVSLSKGKVLISNPLLEEDYFTRSVILIVQHDESGTLGFVLNNTISESLKQIDPELPLHSLPISIGGPMEKSNLFIIHRESPIFSDSKHINENLFFGGNFKELKERYQLQKDPHTVRYFLGYSGWSKNQLQEEIDENAWIVCENIPIESFFNPKIEDFWKYAMELQGVKFKRMINFPLNPSYN